MSGPQPEKFVRGINAVVEALPAVRGDDLLEFLKQQRWFAAKGAPSSDARFTDVVPIALPQIGSLCAVTIVSVRVGASEQSYQLVLAARPVPPDNLPARAVVGVIEPQGHAQSSVTLFDAAYDADFRRALAWALHEGYTARNDRGLRWIVEPVPGAKFFMSPDAEMKVGSAEQSNTSIVFGDVGILKLFRKLAPGVQPDLEVTGFLTTRAHFAHTPALLGSIRFERDGEELVGGMLQQFMPGSGDAWSYALERGKPYFAAPAGRDAPNAFLDDARQLGRITREMHDALASSDDVPDFEPVPAMPEDLDRWAHRAQQSARDALALLEKQVEASSLPPERLAEARVLVQRRDRYLAWINELADRLGEDLGVLARIHGDYHLGQVLHTKSGDFMIIDFEGEPARPLDERREKASPLRDVAGMLRSFAYAAATLGMSVEKTHDLPTRELRIARWERDVRAAYLDGYLGEEDDDAPDLLPETREHVQDLIMLFETEKAFYELAYELNNRPDWVGIPMRGISKLLVG